MRELSKEENSIVSGAGDLYDSPISHDGQILIYPDNIYARPGYPIYEIWQQATAI